MNRQHHVSRFIHVLKCDTSYGFSDILNKTGIWVQIVEWERVKSTKASATLSRMHLYVWIYE